jgi:hypothetical protein
MKKPAAPCIRIIEARRFQVDGEIFSTWESACEYAELYYAAVFFTYQFVVIANGEALEEFAELEAAERYVAQHRAVVNAERIRCTLRRVQSDRACSDPPSADVRVKVRQRV